MQPCCSQEPHCKVLCYWALECGYPSKLVGIVGTFERIFGSGWVWTHRLGYRMFLCCTCNWGKHWARSQKTKCLSSCGLAELVLCWARSFFRLFLNPSWGLLCMLTQSLHCYTQNKLMEVKEVIFFRFLFNLFSRITKEWLNGGMWMGWGRIQVSQALTTNNSIIHFSSNNIFIFK